MTKDKALNLDELFGRARPVVVVWQGERYELVRPEALTPVEYQRWVALQRRMAPLFDGLDNVDNMTEKQAEELNTAITEALGLFNAELAAAGLPFAAKIKVLEFYTEQVFEPQKAGDPNPIGA